MPKVVSVDAAFGGIAWVIYDGVQIVARGWRSFPADRRTLRGLAEWLDATLLPHCGCIERVFVETTNVFGAPDGADGTPRMFMLQQQVSVRECAQAVAMWCAVRGISPQDPDMVMPQTWRASFKTLIPKPRPKGAAQWKTWSQRTSQQLIPGCLDGLGKKASEDTADAIMLAIHGWGALHPAAKGAMKKDAATLK